MIGDERQIAYRGHRLVKPPMSNGGKRRDQPRSPMPARPHISAGEGSVAGSNVLSTHSSISLLEKKHEFRRELEPVARI